MGKVLTIQEERFLARLEGMKYLAMLMEHDEMRAVLDHIIYDYKSMMGVFGEVKSND